MYKNITLTLAAAVAITGCESPQTQRTEGTTAAYLRNVEAIKQQAGLAPDKEKAKATTKVNKPYFGSKSIPFRAKTVLPENFKRRYGFYYPTTPMSLSQAVSRIASITGIPVRIAPDVGTSADARPVVLNASATGEEILDQVCREQGLNWELRSDGTAIIQRFVTKHLTLMVQPGGADFEFSLGKNGQSQASSSSTGSGGTISTGFTSTAKVGKTAKMNPLASTVEAISKVLSKEGKVTASDATGTIVVIDTPEGAEAAAKIVERENEVLTRQAVFHVEVISFRMNETDQSGIDWQTVFNNLNKVGATLTSPKSLVGSAAGGIGIELLSGTGSVGRFDSTKAFISLLNEHGKTATIYKNDIRTRNRSVTTVQSLAQNVYIARTTPAPAGVNGQSGGTPGLEPGTVTAGVDLKMAPFISDSNQISLLFNFGIVDLSDIVPLTSGVGANQVTIEGPETKSFEFSEETFLTPGVPTLITGYERTLEAYTRRKLGRDVTFALGGSFKGESQSERLFILITPTIVGSAY